MTWKVLYNIKNYEGLKMVKKIKIAIGIMKKIDNWWDCFFDYLGIKKGVIIYKVDGMKIKTRAKTVDKRIFTEVVIGANYFPDWLKLDNNSIVIDLGANIGIFSVMSEGIVYAVEPSKENFEILTNQIKLNKKKILPFKLAISDKKGKLKLYRGKDQASFSLTKKKWEDYEIVNTMTLREFFNQNKIKKCDLLKIDVEGAEYKIIYSTPKNIFDKIDRICMEVHHVKDEPKEKLVKFLEHKGFIVKFKRKENFLWAIKPKRIGN